MADITREELKAMIEVQGETARFMEKIANSLAAVAEEQKELTKEQDKLTEEFNKGTMHDLLVSIRDNILWCKIIMGSIGFLVIIVYVIVRILEHAGG